MSCCGRFKIPSALISLSERERISKLVFTPSQPVRLYQRERQTDRQTDKQRQRQRDTERDDDDDN